MIKAQNTMGMSLEIRHALAHIRRGPSPVLRLSNVATLRHIINDQVSVARYGDGELAYCFKKKSLPFQPWHQDLSHRLERALLSRSPNVLPCFNHMFERADTVRWITSLERSSKQYVRRETLLSENDIGLLDRHKQHRLYRKCWKIIESEAKARLYGEATAFYLGLYVEEYAAGQLDEIKSLFRNLFRGKRILFVCPAAPLMGDSFMRLEPMMRRLGLLSAQFIEIPSIDAYRELDEIQSRITQSRGFDEIFIQAGPVASVLATELTERLNVRVIDAGSLNTQMPYL